MSDLANVSIPSMTVTEEGGRNFMTWLQDNNKKDLYDKIVTEWTVFCNEAVLHECLYLHLRFHLLMFAQTTSKTKKEKKKHTHTHIQKSKVLIKKSPAIPDALNLFIPIFVLCDIE